MPVDIRCDGCRNHLDSGAEVVCRTCAERAFEDGRLAGYKAGYEDGKTAQIFGEEPPGMEK
jgi:hypothetical protein